MRSKFLRRTGAALLALSLILSLSLPAAAAPPAQEAEVTKVTVTPSTLDLSIPGTATEPETGTLVATVTTDGSGTTPAVSWRTSNPKVVDVDQNGNVTAMGPGDARITAVAGGKSAQCVVTVKKPAIGLKLVIDNTETDAGSLELEDGSVVWLRPVLTPKDTTDKVTWTVSDQKPTGENKEVAVVKTAADGYGIIQASGVGTATITAKAGSVSATCTVTVTAVSVTSIKLNRTELKLEKGDNAELKADFTPSTSSNQGIIWSSSDETVVTVNEKGEIMAVGAGKATITATAKDTTNGTITATCAITVTDSQTPEVPDDPNADKAKKIELIPPPADPDNPDGEKMEFPLTLVINETAQLTAKVYDADDAVLEDAKVIWSSSNPDAASVSADGLITPKNEGQAKITAVCGDAAASCEVTVVAAEKPISSLSFSPDQIQFVNKDAPPQELKPNLMILPTAAGRKPVEWSGSDDTIAKVDPETGTVTPVSPGEMTVTASAKKVEGEETPKVSAECKVIVSGVRLSLGDDADRKPITTYELVNNKTVSLAASYFGAASNGPIQWTSSDNSIVSVSSGRVTARGMGSAKITVTRNGYSATCEVTVVENTEGVVKDRAEAGKPFDISGLLARLNRAFKEATGSTSNLSYITSLSVPPEQGILYYNYASAADPGLGVGSAEKYYYDESVQGERYISRLTFVSNPEFSGAATIRYTGFGPNRETFSGAIILEVEGAEDVTYSTILNTPVTFKAADFNTICKVRTGRELSYVTFTLPQPQQGSLYFNYATGSLYAEKVTSATKYFRDRSPSVGQISFLPGDDYTGTVTISYRATDTSGASFNGQVTIRVTSRNSAGLGDVNYLANQGEPVTFQTSDFNSVCRDALGETLDYVRFTPPASNVGVLYYNYQGNGSYGSIVKGDDRFYRASSPAIDGVTFVPASGGPSPVTIAFSGYGSRGTRFDGTIVIQYSQTSTGNTVTYSIRSGRYVRFDVADFNELCQSTTGGTLNYLQFSLPPSNLGALYYGYDETRDNYADVVSSSASYYRTGRNLLIDNISFVAALGCTGTVEIPFTGRTTGNREFNGMVRIQVLSPTPEPLHYNTIAAPVALSAADFSQACSRLLTGELSYIQFTSLPAASAGTMYSGYSGLGTGTKAAVGIVYYASGSPSLDQLSFVPKAGFEGTVSFDYTAQDVNGSWVHGTGEIVVSNSGTSHFLDLGSHTWAAGAVDFLYQTGVVNGISKNSFGPGNQIRRGDFVLMLCRAFRFNTGSTVSFPDVNPNSYYAQAVATAKDLGITTGDNGYFKPDQPLTRQDAMVMVRRAMQAAGWNLSASNHSYLSGFADGAYISLYARDAVALMVQMGIVNGSAGLLNPHEQISRAEMAVILHRVLTL